MTPGVLELADRPSHPIPRAGDVESALGGDLLAAFRDERGLIRADVGRNVDHFVIAGQLEIQGDGDRFPQQADVAILDVAAVLAEMKCDPVGPAELGQGGGPDRIGLVGLAGLADGGDVVDVDPKFGHSKPVGLVQRGGNDAPDRRIRFRSRIPRPWDAFSEVLGAVRYSSTNTAARS